MITQLLKIIWKQRNYNAIMTIEIGFSFIALFALSAIMIHYYKRYNEPLGMNCRDTWFITARQPWDLPAESKVSDSILMVKLDQIKRNLKSNYPEILEISKVTSCDILYTFNVSSSCSDYKKKNICYSVSPTEPEFAKAAGLKILEGRWINMSDASSPIKTVTINQRLKKEFFGNGSAAGKTIYLGNEKPEPVKIVGVFESLKRNGDFKEEDNFMFNAHHEKYNPYSGFVAKLRMPINNNFEPRIMKDLESMDKTFKYRIEKLENMHHSYIMSQLAPIIIAGAIVIFLIVNVMLGLFGTLWLSTNRRKSEIGLRMAIGGSSRNILIQLLTETYCLTIISVLIGFIFTSQLFIFNFFQTPVATLIQANLLAFFLILLFATISAFAPGKMASMLQPAEALHEE